MVKTDSGDSKAPAITSRLFLNSVKKWHEDNGIHICISQVGNLVETDKDDRVSLPLNIEICEEMPKCRARVIGDDGKPVKIEDDLGNMADKIEIVSNPEEFTLWIKLAVQDPANDEYKCFNLGSGFPLINFAFIQEGSVSNGNKKNLIFTYDELVDALEGLECKAFAEIRNFKGGNNYPVLIPQAL